eukprot:gene33277-40260_t
MADLGLEDLGPFFSDILRTLWDEAIGQAVIVEGYVLRMVSKVTGEEIAYALLVMGGVLLSYWLTRKRIEDLRFKYTLLFCWKDLVNMMERSHCQPILLRLAFADAATYDYTISEWPKSGGVNGSIAKCEALMNETFNAGLAKAIAILAPFKKKYSTISWADLIQMAGAAAVHSTGGPLIRLAYGRRDIDDQHPDLWEDLSNNGVYLPKPYPPYPLGEPMASAHLRILFNRMGLHGKEVVALMGAHTIGRAFQDRSGVCPFYSGEQGATTYTKVTSSAHGSLDMKKKDKGVGMAGGCSWTKNWLQFDNSYFKRPFEDVDNKELLWLPTDEALMQYPLFREHLLRYSKDQQAFFEDYAAAHKKMSELGAKFDRYIFIPFSEK